MYDTIKQQFSKAVTTYDTNAIAQKEIAKKLYSLIVNYLDSKTPTKIFEFGCGTGNLSELLSKISTKLITLNDLCNNNINTLKLKINKDFEYKCGDINLQIDELIKENKSYNLIASASTFQWIDNPYKLLQKLSNILENNGLLAISTFSPDNLFQIKQTLNIGLNYLNVSELEKLFNKYYNIIYLKEDTINIYFNNVIDILKHLKLTGVNSLNSNIFTRSKLIEFENNYQKFKINDNRFVLTYKPVYIIATKK